MNADRTNSPRVVLLVATRKGAWIYHGDAARKTWRVDGPHFLGHIISHLVLDPRDGKTLLAAAKTGHLGPIIFRSTDFGKSWQEARQPPAFAPPQNGTAARSVDHTFWLTPGNAEAPGLWYAGTSPQGLFRSQDGGVSWSPFSIVNDDPKYRLWMGSEKDGTPDGPKLHSIIVDPRNARHLYLGMSGGGVHETRDGGESFTTLIEGMEVVQGLDPAIVTFHARRAENRCRRPSLASPCRCASSASPAGRAGKCRSGSAGTDGRGWMARCAGNAGRIARHLPEIYAVETGELA